MSSLYIRFNSIKRSRKALTRTVTLHQQGPIVKLQRRSNTSVDRTRCEYFQSSSSNIDIYAVYMCIERCILSVAFPVRLQNSIHSWWDSTPSARESRRQSPSTTPCSRAFPWGCRAFPLNLRRSEQTLSIEPQVLGSLTIVVLGSSSARMKLIR